MGRRRCTSKNSTEVRVAILMLSGVFQVPFVEDVVAAHRLGDAANGARREALIAQPFRSRVVEA